MHWLQRIRGSPELQRLPAGHDEMHGWLQRYRRTIVPPVFRVRENSGLTDRDEFLRLLK